MACATGRHLDWCKFRNLPTSTTTGRQRVVAKATAAGRQSPAFEGELASVSANDQHRPVKAATRVVQTLQTSRTL
jgi:hypothetical protein